jgi:hypothetical protein
MTCLKIFRALHPPYLLEISPFDFGIFEYFKRKLKNYHLHGSEENFTIFQELWDNITFEELQIVFES